MSDQTLSAASIGTVAERAVQICVRMSWPLAVGAEAAEAETKHCIVLHLRNDETARPFDIRRRRNPTLVDALSTQR